MLDTNGFSGIKRRNKMKKTSRILCGVAVGGALLIGCAYVAVCAHNGRYLRVSDKVVYDTWRDRYALVTDSGRVFGWIEIKEVKEVE